MLRQSPVFRSCTTEEIDVVLASSVKVRQYEKNAEILPEGIKTNGVYLLVNGKVKLISHSDGRELIVEIVWPGNIFGYEALINTTGCVVGATAMETSEIYFIPEADFMFVFKHNERFALDLFKQVCRRLDDSIQRMTYLSYQPAEQRVASALLYLQKSCSTQNGVGFKANRSDIGKIAGVSRETATKIVKEWERDQLISIKDDNISIIGQEELIHVENKYA